MTHTLPRCQIATLIFSVVVSLSALLVAMLWSHGALASAEEGAPPAVSGVAVPVGRALVVDELQGRSTTEVETRPPVCSASLEPAVSMGASLAQPRVAALAVTLRCQRPEQLPSFERTARLGPLPAASTNTW
ncbi:MAG TPA: hypothetical protein VFK02_31690 [Kofleriaceae bacterium]|nr:hypothetical protein [Kofleriaceae bacterium]